MKALYKNYRLRTRQDCVFWYACIIYAILFIIYAACFYFQTLVGETGNDIAAHISFAKSLTSKDVTLVKIKAYPLIYLFISLFGNAVRSYKIGAGLLSGCLAVATAVLTAQFIRYFTLRKVKDIYVVLLSALLQFAWPIFLPFVTSQAAAQTLNAYSPIWKLYLASGASASRHNITSNGVKPFAIVTLWLFLWLLQEFFLINSDEFNKRKNKQNTVSTVFSIALFVSVLAKPSFFQVFSFAAVITVVFFLFQYGKDTFKKSFWYCTKIGLAFVPTTLYVLFQMKTGLDGVTAISPFTVWRHYCDHIPVAILAATAFPLFVMMTQKVKNTALGVSLLMVVVGIVEQILLFQPDEPWSGNFMWGYHSAQYFFILTAAIVLMNKIVLTKKIGATQIVAGGLLSMHILTGLYAFLEYIYYFATLHF